VLDVGVLAELQSQLDRPVERDPAEHFGGDVVAGLGADVERLDRQA
jgi:hypothetical protein